MSKADELKSKNENLFERNTILLNENERLQKENAELKRRLDNLFNSDCWASEKLTKAKELLTKWVELFKPKLEGYSITPIQEQTEQFLKEIEK